VSSKTAAEKVAALRDEYTRLGQNVDHLTDVDLLHREVDRLAAESRRHENSHSALLQDRVKRDRSVYAAARRSAQASVVAVAGLYLQAIIRKNASPIDGVIYRAEQLPEDGKAPVKQVRELREAALRARWLLKGMASEQAIEDAKRDEGVQVVEELKAEIRRMRDVLTEQGQRLHRDHADLGSTLGRCECPGCELIRAMDDTLEPPEAVRAA
jgi:hypothetical protein